MEKVQLSDQTLLQELNRLIGASLIATTADMREPRRLNSIGVRRQGFSFGERERLEVAYTLFNDVAESRGAQEALAWFVGVNGNPASSSPMELIRRGDFIEAEAAALGAGARRS